MLKASVPSRICLFGEHQDYLGLEVIAAAVDLRFSAMVTPRTDGELHIRIRDRSIAGLNELNPGLYEETVLTLGAPQVYTRKRDYFKSVVNVLTRAGYRLGGADVLMDSDIPIGKGMCSSTTMILALMAALSAQFGAPLEPMELARFGWEAEVLEFQEPGGMMDHYTAALGGLLHIDFSSKTVPERLTGIPKGDFILFDSLEEKDTLAVLAGAKTPTLEGLRILASYGVRSIRDLACDPALERQISRLPGSIARRVQANVDNYRLQRQAYRMFCSGEISDDLLGGLLNREQDNLRDGLGISTDRIDTVLALARSHGAFGGKFNGSGGGGCLFCYAPRVRTDEILSAVRLLGIPGKRLTVDEGLRLETL